MIQTISRTILIFSSSIWLGAMVYFSFFAAPAIFKNLPRDTASELIGILIPRYYSLGFFTSCAILASALVYYLFVTRSNTTFTILILSSLLFMAATYSGKVIQPKAHMIKAEIRKTIDGPEKDRLTQQFKGTHKISMILNILMLLNTVSLLGLSLTLTTPRINS